MRAESTRLIWPGTDAERHAAAGVDDRVGLHKTSDVPGKHQICDLGGRRLTLRDAPQGAFCTDLIVGSLHKQPPADALEVKVVVRLAESDREKTKILLGGEDLNGLLGEARSNDAFCKLAGHEFRTLTGHFTVKGNDASECRLGIRLKCLGVSLCRTDANGNAARIGMLDDHAGGRLEGADALPSGIAVGNVVVGKLLALKLLIAGKKTRSNRCFAIEGGSLMGIFPVAHVLNFFPLAGKNLREASALIVFIKTREIVRDHAVVAGSMSEDLLGERQGAWRP